MCGNELTVFEVSGRLFIKAAPGVAEKGQAGVIHRALGMKTRQRRLDTAADCLFHHSPGNMLGLAE